MTRQQKSTRANERRKFFNSGKPHCKSCGSLLVMSYTLEGSLVQRATCPLAACPRNLLIVTNA